MYISKQWFDLWYSVQPITSWRKRLVCALCCTSDSHITNKKTVKEMMNRDLSGL